MRCLRLTYMSSKHESTADLDSSTDRIVKQINSVDNKVTQLRKSRMSDPDTLSDKALKWIIPTLTGLVASKVFQMVWDKVTAKAHPSPLDDDQDHQQGIMMSMIFAALSAAFSTLLTQASDRSTNSFVHHLQNRRDAHR